MSHLSGSHRKLPPPKGKAGPWSQTAGQGRWCGSALALSTPGWGQGGWAKLWKAKDKEQMLKAIREK